MLVVLEANRNQSASQWKADLVPYMFNSSQSVKKALSAMANDEA